jgi:hypothetical protein
MHWLELGKPVRQPLYNVLFLFFPRYLFTCREMPASTSHFDLPSEIGCGAILSHFCSPN